MKTLYIVRHAKSSWKYDELSDFERPLNQRGRNDAPMMGKWLREQDISPDLIISSAANRAVTTARMIAYAMHYPVNEIVVSMGLYEAGKSDIIDLIARTNPAISSLMIFGHNPELTDLANFLGDSFIDNIPTTGIVCLQLEKGGWKDFSESACIQKFFVTPKTIS